MSRVLEILEDENNIELIDLFNVLMEKVQILNMSKFKGILLQGESEKEYNKIFNNKKNKEEKEYVEV